MSNDNNENGSGSNATVGWSMFDIGGAVHLRNNYTMRVFRLGLTSAPFEIPMWPVENVTTINDENRIDCGRFVSDLTDRQYSFQTQRVPFEARKWNLSSASNTNATVDSAEQEATTSSVSLDGRIQCHVCNATFGRPCELQNHLKTHPLSVPSQRCEYCEKPYSNKSNLARHVSKKHVGDLLNKTM